VSYHPGQTTSGVRYREDVGLELRCRACRTYWPLEREWWDFRSFSRCNACARKAKNASARRRMQEDPELRRRRRIYQVQYRKDAKAAKSLYAFDRYWANVEVERERARDRYYANRETILEKKRQKYAQRKAA
jgi:hypothetical protein